MTEVTDKMVEAAWNTLQLDYMGSKFPLADHEYVRAAIEAAFAAREPERNQAELERLADEATKWKDRYEAEANDHKATIDAYEVERNKLLPF